MLAGTDFLTVEVLTLHGLVTYYVLFFIHLASRVDEANGSQRDDGRVRRPHAEPVALWRDDVRFASLGYSGVCLIHSVVICITEHTMARERLVAQKSRVCDQLPVRCSTAS